MITEIITFDIPNGMTRDEVVANYRRSDTIGVAVSGHE
jgi:hypothetical protein